MLKKRPKAQIIIKKNKSDLSTKRAPDYRPRLEQFHVHKVMTLARKQRFELIQLHSLNCVEENQEGNKIDAGYLRL